MKKLLAGALASLVTAISLVGVFSPLSSNAGFTDLAIWTAQTQVVSEALTVSGWIIQVEDTDVNLATEASGNYLASAFWILAFLSVMALLAWWKYVLWAIMSILPGGWGSKK